jgi:hypothetical protein
VAGSDDVRALALALLDEERSSSEWGDARSRLWKALEADLRSYVKEHPGHDPLEPMSMFYAWHDGVLESLRSDDVAYRVVEEVLNFSMGTWEKTTKKAIAAGRSKGRGDEKQRVTVAHPTYPELLEEIRQAKRSWKAADESVKKTHAFRMMGGLARLGLREKTAYDSLVREAQRMERSVLGKTLTS